MRNEETAFLNYWRTRKEITSHRRVMSPVLLLALLGVTFPLPGVQELLCQLGTLKEVWNVSQLPVHWTPKEISCDSGLGCQDTMVLIESGPQVSLVLSKGCTEAKDQEPRITEHRMGPGLSVLSYTYVCRHKDFCNNLVTTAPLWTPQPPAGACLRVGGEGGAVRRGSEPGSLRCPVCLSMEGCPEGTTEEMCPKGTTHCYNGLLRFRGEGIFSNLRVQGCLPQPGCNLLNGTQEIGPVRMTENCKKKDFLQLKPVEFLEEHNVGEKGSGQGHHQPFQLGRQRRATTDFLTCHRGNSLQKDDNLAQVPIEWTMSNTVMCEAGQVCQETLLLIDVGHTSTLVWSKGCSAVGAQNSQKTSIHSAPPGVLVASYAHFCSSDLCNGASSSSVLLNSLPPQGAPEPGDQQCLTCVQPFETCSSDSPVKTCPRGTTHCYDGYISLSGGGVTTTMGIQGCVAQPSSSLLKHTRQIGIFSVREKGDSESGGAGGLESLTWGVGLALALALWWGALCPSC
ncbi:PREDICTED: CD177 antigen isoform X2 [Cercocebus atys]|uniref:CD177 antigen isoform X2 n=1 Tax=Cercocebus atys TaxID=9531 RepID=UPI0005F386C4|nr:PREDICTED: CD177 antigen isoform X2 [Cercocebus atys]